MKCGVHHEDRADLVGHRPERREVDQPRDGRAATDDHPRAVLEGQVADLVVVDVLGGRRDAVVDGVEPLAGEGDLGAVGEVAAVRQAHGQHRLARLDERAVGGQVRAGPGVRLQVGVLRAEQLLGPLDADRLGLVDLAAAAVVAASGVALGVLVRQGRAECGEHGGRGEVLAGDQLQTTPQPVQLGEQHSRDLRVLLLELGKVGTPEGHLGHGLLPDGSAARPSLRRGAARTAV
jgi:hypothetical protein